MGVVQASLTNLSQSAKEAVKVTALANAGIATSFSKNGYDITITDGPKVAGKLLEVSITASKGGIPVTVSNPLYFKNPPILTVVNNVVREDLVETLKEIIAQVVDLKFRGKI